MSRIYCDLDMVLHNYNETFFIHAKNHGFNFDGKIDPSHPNFKGACSESLFPFVTEHGMTEEKMWDIIRDANVDLQWRPTTFAHHIVDFIKKNLETHDPIIITARHDRHAATKLAFNIFGFHPFVITTDIKYKWVAMDSKVPAYHFEDDPRAINTILSNHENIKVIMPIWPWNFNKVNYKKNFMAIERDRFSNLEQKINERWRLKARAVL